MKIRSQKRIGVGGGEVRIEEDALARLKLMCANELEVFFFPLASAGDLPCSFSAAASRPSSSPHPSCPVSSSLSHSPPTLTIPALGLSGHLFLIPASRCFLQVGCQSPVMLHGVSAGAELSSVEDMVRSGLVLLGRVRWLARRQVGPPGNKGRVSHTQSVAHH